MKQSNGLDDAKPTTANAEPAVLTPPPTLKSAIPAKTAVHNVPPVPPVVVPPHPQLTIIEDATATNATANSTVAASIANVTHAFSAPEPLKVAEGAAPPSPPKPASTVVPVSVSVTDNSDTPNLVHQMSAANSDSAASQYGGSVAPYEPSPYVVSDDTSVTPESSVVAHDHESSLPLQQAAAAVSVDAVNHSLSYSDDGNSNMKSDATNAQEDHNNPVSRGDSPVETAVFEVPPSVDGDAQLGSFLAQDDEEEEEEKGNCTKITAIITESTEVTHDTSADKEGDSDSDTAGASPTSNGIHTRTNHSNSRSTHSTIKKIADDGDSSDEEAIEGERGNAKLNQKVNFGGKLLRSVKSVTQKSPTAVTTGPSSGGLRKARPSGNKNVSINSGNVTSNSAVLKGVTDLEEVDL